MNIRFGSAGRTLIVELKGELDHHYVSEIREKIDRKYARGEYRDMVFDMSGVEFMDSSGVGLLIGRFKNVNLNGGMMYAVSMRDDINRLFEIAGLKKLITVCSDIRGIVREDISYEQ